MTPRTWAMLIGEVKKKNHFGKERTNLSKISHSLVRLVALMKVDRD